MPDVTGLGEASVPGLIGLLCGFHPPLVLPSPEGLSPPPPSSAGSTPLSSEQVSITVMGQSTLAQASFQHRGCRQTGQAWAPHTLSCLLWLCACPGNPVSGVVCAASDDMAFTQRNCILTENPPAG